VLNARDESTLEAALQEAKGANQLTMLEVACAVGARADLGRPTTTPIQNRDALLHFCGRKGMIALLLNSGLGSRMGDETREHPKCMCSLTEQETIISWQVKLLRRIGVTEAVVTTGHLADTLIAYLESLDSGIRFHFVHNPKYRETNYIYSMSAGKIRRLPVVRRLTFHAARVEAVHTYAPDTPVPNQRLEVLVRQGLGGIHRHHASARRCQRIHHRRMQHQIAVQADDVLPAQQIPRQIHAVNIVRLPNPARRCGLLRRGQRGMSGGVPLASGGFFQLDGRNRALLYTCFIQSTS